MQPGLREHDDRRDQVERSAQIARKSEAVEQRRRQFEALAGDADEPQICRGID